MVGQNTVHSFRLKSRFEIGQDVFIDFIGEKYTCIESTLVGAQGVTRLQGKRSELTKARRAPSDDFVTSTIHQGSSNS